ncbi:MAG: DHHA1 domain-containing protein [Aggregatilineales bacterium]
MTKRLYYDDSHTRQFTTKIVDHATFNNQPAVILDETYFYPTGGGQPHDVGTINGVVVKDVISGDDGTILHVLEAEIMGDSAQCDIDWTRRFDHMQHHTGQHVLTQAFVQVADAQTVGFHLSAESVTIDIDRNTISETALREAETLANSIVFDNRPVTAQIVDPSALDDVRMRKMPEKIYTDGLRVIDVDGFDRTACGGTHVSATGEIGLIKIIKTEKRGDKLRVEFRCGRRALWDYDAKNASVNALSSLLTCHQDELVEALERLQTELKQSLRDIKQVTNLLLDYEAPMLLAGATLFGDIHIVSKGFDNRDANELRGLATRLTEHENVIVLIGTSGEKAHLVYARSKNLPNDMNLLLKESLSQLGDGRGGGRPELAQGGGVPATVASVEEVLFQAIERVTS